MRLKKWRRVRKARKRGDGSLVGGGSRAAADCFFGGVLGREKAETGLPHSKGVELALVGGTIQGGCGGRGLI